MSRRHAIKVCSASSVRRNSDRSSKGSTPRLFRPGCPRAPRSSDTAKAQVLSVEQSPQDGRQKVLKSAVSTVAALRRLLADYERLETERNDFERERARVLLENDRLRRQAKEATDQRELLVRALETLTTRMDAVGVICIEAAKTARAQSFDSAPPVPASEPPNEDQTSEPTT